MARGDVVSDIQDIADGAFLDFQPSAGVEVMITTAGVEAAAEVRLLMRNATLILAILFETGGVNHNLGAGHSVPLFKIMLNNTNFIRFEETGAATVNIAFTGIQTK